jgi:hypothetical protein
MDELFLDVSHEAVDKELARAAIFWDFIWKDLFLNSQSFTSVMALPIEK